MNIFENLSVEEREVINEYINPIEKIYNKGTTIFYEGDGCDYIAFVNEGTVIAKQSFSDGHDNIIKVIGKNEYIGINLIYSSFPIYKASFIASTDTRITLYSFNDLIHVMKISSIVLKNILRIISDYAINLNEHIKLLSQKTIKAKICYYLYNEYIKQGKKTFKLTISKTDLAAMLNIERPSLSFEIKKLINEGIIENKNRDYTILSLDKLMQQI